VPSRLTKSQLALVEAYREGLGARAAAELSADALNCEALAVAARVEGEIARMQRDGELKSVNASYRAYRLAAVARGESVVSYAEWMNRYKANLVREIAAALR
jgi:hypothetical protein